MSVTIRSEKVKQWFASAEPFSKVAAIDGLVVRSKEGRTTQRFEIDGEGFYVKLHTGVGWWEIAKNLLQLRMPILGARNEWRAIDRLHSLGVHTMELVAFGERGNNPATQHSFVMTRELTQTISLAVFCESWEAQPPSPALKRALINKVATIAASLHSNGLNHRDLYICHFLMDIATGVENLDGENLRLFLVDLHRMGIRPAVPRRWLVKDVGSIYFSAMDIGLTKRDIFRFMKAYTGQPLRQALRDKKGFWQQVQQRADRLYWRDWKKAPKKLF